MRDLALAYLTIDRAGPVEQVEIAAAAGFRSVGLRILSPSHLQDRTNIVGRPDLVRAVRAALHATGLRAFDAEVVTLSPATSAASFAPFVATAAELGCRFVQVVCEDGDRSRGADNLAALARTAAEHGLGVALEFMAFRAVRTLGEATALVNAARQSNLAVIVDALHLDRSGGSPADVARVPRSQVAYLQLCDAPAGRPAPASLADEARHARLHPGEGGLPLRDLLAAVGPDMPISIEVPHRDDAGLPLVEKARRAGDAARRFLSGG